MLFKKDKYFVNKQLKTTFKIKQQITFKHN